MAHHHIKGMPETPSPWAARSQATSSATCAMELWVSSCNGSPLPGGYPHITPQPRPQRPTPWAMRKSTAGTQTSLPRRVADHVCVCVCVHWALNTIVKRERAVPAAPHQQCCLPRGTSSQQAWCTRKLHKRSGNGACKTCEALSQECVPYGVPPCMSRRGSGVARAHGNGPRPRAYAPRMHAL